MKTMAALLLVLLVCGCGRREESVAKTAGSKVGETITDFASGVGKGVDKQRMVRVTLSEAVCKQGLSKTISKSGNGNGITVYFLAASPFKGKLVAKATNKEGQEIGRSVVDVEFSPTTPSMFPSRSRRRWMRSCARVQGGYQEVVAGDSGLGIGRGPAGDGEERLSMIRGRVQNGVVVLEPRALREGTEVAVEPLPRAPKKARPPSGRRSVCALVNLAGKARHLPPDAARNLDHCLYRHAKR